VGKGRSARGQKDIQNAQRKECDGRYEEWAVRAALLNLGPDPRFFGRREKGPPKTRSKSGHRVIGG